MASERNVKQPVTSAKDPLDTLCINTIRTLSMDAVQAANSGHPGTPMALAPVAYYLWQYILRFDPQDPIWPNRDRFVLSAGHASMLLYSLLHLTGVKAVSKDYETAGRAVGPARRRSRSSGSCTADAPATPSTAGPRASRPPPARSARASATASAWPWPSRWMAAHYNKPGFEDLIDFNVYALCGDGDMMEGISHEAASLAGHLKLSNLCWIYDNNHITIEGKTDAGLQRGRRPRGSWATAGTSPGSATPTTSTCSTERFQTFLETPRPADPDHRRQPHRLGRPHKQDTHGAHGEPLGEEEIRLTKQFYGWPEDAKFLVPDGVYDHFQQGIGKRGKELRDAWFGRLERVQGRSTPSWPTSSTGSSTASSPTAGTRTCRPSPPTPRGWPRASSSGKVLNAVAKNVPWLIGGAADLAPSTKTRLTFDGAGDFEAGNYGGRNLHFGIREHAMGAILNGMATGQGPAVRLGLPDLQRLRPDADPPGRDHGDPGHLRLHARLDRRRRGRPDPPADRAARRRSGRSPACWCIRPGDANEVVEAWRVIMQLRHQPAVLVLTRQDLPTLDRTKYAPASGLAKGAYILADAPDGKPDVILMATGSEVSLCVEAYEKLKAEGIKARVVSMPSLGALRRPGPGLSRPGPARPTSRPASRSSRPRPSAGRSTSATDGHEHRHAVLRGLGPAQGPARGIRLHRRSRRRCRPETGERRLLTCGKSFNAPGQSKKTRRRALRRLGSRLSCQGRRDATVPGVTPVRLRARREKDDKTMQNG